MTPVKAMHTDTIGRLDGMTMARVRSVMTQALQQRSGGDGATTDHDQARYWKGAVP
jgi:hypothetical protein